MKKSSALFLNPYVTVGNMDDDESLHIHAPVRHQIVLRTPIDPVKDSSDFSQLMKWANDGFPKKVMAEDCSEKIRNTGLYLPKNLIPREIGYDCNIEAVESEMKYWVDRDRLILMARERPEKLVVNPDVKIENNSPRDFCLKIKDPFTRVSFPLQLTEYHRKLFTNLLAGKMPIEKLSAKLKDLYLISRILVPRKDKHTTEMYQREKNSIKFQLQKDRYANLPNIINLPQLVHIRNFYEKMIDEGYAYKNGPDDEIQRECFFKDDPKGVECMREYLPFFRKICEKPIKAGIYYLMAYQPGEVLVEHRDGPESSEFSVSIQLYYRHNGRLTQNQWPLYLENKTLLVQPGDGVIFMGQELSHRRDPLPKDQKSGIILFSYHDKDYSGEVF